MSAPKHAAAQVKALNEVYERGHRVVRYLILMHLLLSILFAGYYQTWGISISVAALASLAFFVVSKFSPHSFFARAVNGILLQTFCALHIYQFHGLAEMHFFFFTSFAVMIVYCDRLCMWPGCLLIIAQHILFAILHNSGFNVQFFEQDYVTFTKLFFHFGIALFHVGICSTWAQYSRQQIIDAVNRFEDARLRDTEIHIREQLLGSIIDNSPAVIYAKDLDGRFVLANQTFLKIFNLAKDKVIGRSNHEIFQKDIADQFRKNDLDAQNSLVAILTEERAVLANGEHRMYSSEKFRIIGDDGAVKLICGISQDITEKLATEKLINDQRTKLAHSSKLSSLGEMAGGIAHEINNPLAIIKGMLPSMARSLNSPIVDVPKLNRAIEIIETTTDRIAKIVKGLRSFARDGSNDPVSFATVKDVVEDALSLIQEKLVYNGIKIFVEYDPNLKPIEMRPVEIAQVIVNLLSNAFDAVIENEERWIKVICSELSNGIEIKMINSGEKIASELVEKIMEPFFTTKSIGKGTGLGLSISRGLVEAHHGSLKLQQDSEYTTFVVYLPRHQSKKAV